LDWALSLAETTNKRNGPVKLPLGVVAKWWDGPAGVTLSLNSRFQKMNSPYISDQTVGPGGLGGALGANFLPHYSIGIDSPNLGEKDRRRRFNIMTCPCQVETSSAHHHIRLSRCG
jgi:hypothetical protein